MQDTELFLSLAEIAGVFVGFGALISIRSAGASDAHETDPSGGASGPQGRSVPMPKFMDVHHDMVGITAEALVAAHAGDLAIQADEGVDFEHAWADPESGNVFCLSEAPSAEAVQRIHTRNGIPPAEIYPLPLEV